MSTIEIPFPTFVVRVPDDTLGSRFPAGTELAFDQQRMPKAGYPVVLRDATGDLSLHLFAGAVPAGFSVVGAACAEIWADD